MNLPDFQCKFSLSRSRCWLRVYFLAFLSRSLQEQQTLENNRNRDEFGTFLGNIRFGRWCWWWSCLYLHYSWFWILMLKEWHFSREWDSHFNVFLLHDSSAIVVTMLFDDIMLCNWKIAGRELEIVEAGAIWGQIENWPLHTILTHPSLCTVLSHIAMNVSDPHFWMIEIVRHWIRFNAEEAKRVDLTNGLHPSGCILPILLLLLLQLSLLLPLLLLLLSKLWILILLLSPAAAADPFPVAHDSSCRRCGLLDAF